MLLRCQSSNPMAHLFLLILLLPYSISTSVHAYYETECSSLLSFGRTLSSPPLNWTTVNCCRWKGITCNEDGSVTHLHLPYEGLKGGTFPSFSSLGNLTNLNHLNLSHNSLYGSFEPEFFSSFSHLQILDLSYNLLSGQLPAFSPPSHNIRTLDLSSNQFHGALPSTVFQQAWNLTSFNVSNNTLSGSIPSPFCLRSSPMLRLLDFSANDFSGNIAPGLGHCSKLEVFRAGYNNLSGFLPEDVYTATKLEEISLASNSIYGPFSDKIGNLTNLKTLDLSLNPFGGVLPTQFGKLSKLKLLVLDSSQLQGSLPPSFTNCTNLVGIHMAENNLGGDISALNFSKFSQLSKLDFSRNRFSGTLPTSLYSCRSLKAIRLSANNISGQIQPEILSLESLSFVSLGNLTNMTGAMKLFMGCKSLRTLLLSSSFKGEAIPDDDAMVGFDGFRNLRFLSFYHCEFTGQIPAWFSKLKNLQILSIRGSRLIGAIPRSLGTLPKLYFIGFPDNRFSGEFPKELCELPRLVHGDPTAAQEDDDYLELPSLTNIFYPRKLSNFPPMIDLSRNHISGKIPIEIGQMRFLHKLDISDNNFIGHIPVQISNLKNLENLTLNMNHLSGEIPESLASLNFLKYLNVSYNDLEGPIPTSTQLQSFDASAFEGNPKLCGPPLHNECLSVDGDGKRNEDVDNGHDNIWFYSFVALGFVVGFWGVCGTLIFKKRWRYAYFQFLDNVQDRLCR